MNYIYPRFASVLTVLLIFISSISYAQVSVTATAGTVGPTAYTSLRDAFNAVNAGTHRGVINIRISANTTETATAIINASGGTANYSSVTIKPAAGTTPVVSGSIASNTLIKMNGSGNVTIDGSNTVNGTTTDLTLTNTNTTNSNVVVIGSTGTTPVNNVVVKNTIITNGTNTSTAVIAGDAATIGNPGYFSNITIQNNTIGRAYIGIYLYSVAGALVNNVTIAGNRLNTTGANAIRLVGIYAQGLRGCNISDNSIGNFESTSAEFDRAIWLATATRDVVLSKNTITGLAYTGTSSYAPIGINVSPGITNANIDVEENTIDNITSSGTYSPTGIFVYSNLSGINIGSNRVSNIRNTNTGGYGATGILLSATNNTAATNVYNNFIWGINSYGFNGYDQNDNGNGIAITSGGGYNIDHNSISLNSNPTLTGAHRASCLLITAGVTATAALNVRNNIFANLQTTGNASSRLCIANLATSGSAVFSNINYNNYYSISGNLSSTGTNASITTTIPQLQASLGGNGNSVSVQPVFVAANDLHLDPFSNAALQNAGMPLPAYPADIDNDTRSTTAPEIGADEISGCPTPIINPSATGIVYVDSSKAISGDGSSWANAVKELAHALKAAKTNTAIQQVWVAKGTYKPLYDAATLCVAANARNRSFVLVNNVKIYGGFAGNETLLTQRNWNTNLTKLSGDIGTLNDNTDNVYHVVISAEAVGSAELNGFTVSEGKADGMAPVTVNTVTINQYSGAGLYINISAPTIKNCIIRDNECQNSGGGIFNRGKGIFDSLVIMYNHAQGGGNVARGGGFSNADSNVVISNSRFYGNTSTYTGGALCNISGSPSLTNIIIENNEAIQFGGGISNIGGNGIFDSLEIINNHTRLPLSGSAGGGFYNQNSNAALSNSRFYNNSSTWDGGGFHTFGGNPVLTDIIIDSNTAVYGGGFYNRTGNPVLRNTVIRANRATAASAGAYSIGNASLVNCLVTGNISDGDSGGWDQVDGNATYVNVTIAGNRAANNFGGLRIGFGSASVSNSIIWGNVGANNSNLGVVAPAVATVTYSTVQGNPVFAGTGNINTDPLFIAAQPAAAAPTIAGNYRLSICGSPSADAGNNAAVPPGITTDLDNNTRIFNSIVDMGAYETQNIGKVYDTIAHSICSGSFYLFNGLNLTATGAYNDTLTTVAGCDSIITLNLTVTPALTGTDVQTICTGQSYTFNGITYTASNNTAQANFPTPAGCDSIVTLNLTVLPALTGTDVQTICQGQSYTFNGISYNTSNNTAQANFPTPAGCDSIVTLNLTVLPALTGTDVQTICQGQSYTFNGITYTTSNNTAQANFPTPAGCDSIVTLNLTVLPALTGTDVQTICQGRSYTFNGITYTTSNNTAQANFPTPAGCDSIVTLNLTVLPALTGTDVQTICQGRSYTFNGISYTTSNNTAQANFPTPAGCDSIVTLNLTVIPSSFSVNVQTICAGDSYTFNGIVYTTNNNTAKDTLVNAAGCDSIITLNLTVRPQLTATNTKISPTCSVASNGSITITPTNGTAPYSFSLNGGVPQLSGTFNNLPVANHTIRITDANNCSNNFTVNLNAGPGITATAATTAACWQSTNGGIIITPSGGNTPYRYSLDGGTAQTTAAFTNVAPGPHSVLVTDANGCTFTLNTTVAENPQITAALAVRNSCRNTNDGTITVNINSGTAPFGYSINNGNSFQPGNIFTGLAANNYSIIVRDNLNCEASFTTTVALQPAVPAFAGNDTTAVKGMLHQLYGSGGVSYVWSPASLLNNATDQNPKATLQNDTRFILEVTDAIGCKGKDTVFIKVYNGPKYYIPNAFTPNGDGLNDVFRPTPVGMVSTEWFRVFNRYGETVFSTSQFMKGWDGTFKGQAQPMGTYVWMIKGKDRNGKIVEEKGTVQLIR